jgi:hypothetical protein
VSPPPYPLLVTYTTADEYRRHFERIYCRGTTTTFDGLVVRFRRDQFEHAFFESVRSKDDTFSRTRAERIDWILAALRDPNAELYVGWDNRKKRLASDTRVCVILGDYVVVIRVAKPDRAFFVTAFVAGPGTLTKIRGGPRWK